MILAGCSKLGELEDYPIHFEKKIKKIKIKFRRIINVHLEISVFVFLLFMHREYKKQCSFSLISNVVKDSQSVIWTGSPKYTDC